MEQAPDASRSPLLAGPAMAPPLKGLLIGAHFRHREGEAEGG